MQDLQYPQTQIVAPVAHIAPIDIATAALAVASPPPRHATSTTEVTESVQRNERPSFLDHSPPSSRPLRPQGDVPYPVDTQEDFDEADHNLEKVDNPVQPAANPISPPATFAASAAGSVLAALEGRRTNVTAPQWFCENSRVVDIGSVTVLWMQDFLGVADQQYPSKLRPHSATLKAT